MITKIGEFRSAEYQRGYSRGFEEGVEEMREELGFEEEEKTRKRAFIEIDLSEQEEELNIVWRG